MAAATTDVSARLTCAEESAPLLPPVLPCVGELLLDDVPVVDVVVAFGEVKTLMYESSKYAVSRLVWFKLITFSWYYTNPIKQSSSVLNKK